MKEILLKIIEDLNTEKENLQIDIDNKKDEIQEIGNQKYQMEVDLMNLEKDKFDIEKKAKEYQIAIKICEELSELVREEE